MEIDKSFVHLLRQEFHDAAEIVHGNGTALPFPANRFSAAVCFTMLHHVPSAEQQDALFAEAHRILHPGGIFTGSDSQPSWRFRLIHLFDTMVTLFGVRLSAVGRLLRKLGLSPQRPLHRAYQQNPEAVATWKGQQYPAIRAEAKKVGANIYFADEAGIRSDYHAGTTWAPVGRTPGGGIHRRAARDQPDPRSPPAGRCGFPP